MEDKIRLLICQTCGTIEALPLYEGDPRYDDWLNSKTSVHKTPSGTPHIGSLATVNSKDWANPTYHDAITKEIAQQLTPAGHGAGFGQTFYDTKDNFLQDAMTCWKGFNRTTDPGHCDYRKDSKRLLPDTRAERKEAGMDPKTRPNTFLCDFCPVHSLVLQKRRKDAGLYDK